MTPPEILDELAQLGIDRSTFRALLILPVLEVAWADGEIQPAELGLILRFAALHELDRSPGEALVNTWVRARPTADFFRRARTILRELLALDIGIGAEIGDKSVSELHDVCEKVAGAAGGLFGLAFTISEEERTALRDITEGLSVGPILDWDALTMPAEAADLADPPSSE